MAEQDFQLFKPYEQIQERSLAETSLIPESERAERVEEFLTRGVETVFPSEESLREALLSGERLTLYMGIDPTAPELHVGHMSQLRKMRRLQDMGHRVVLLIGDFTGMIGDPTDRSAARKKLTREQVLTNSASYITQAGKILDIQNERNPIELRNNSDWLGKMSFAHVLELASTVTVQQMLQRRSFGKRIDEGNPISLVEFLYPIMQGYDSVALNTDIELGGSDQIFNMLVGSQFVGAFLGKQKFVVAGNLLVDPSGKKIGKTEGNMVTLVDDPATMYEKVMRWGDDITPHALELCTTVSMDTVRDIEAKMASGELDKVTAKKYLAATLVSELYSPEKAAEAASKYGNVDAEVMQEAQVEEGTNIVDMLVDAGYATSKSAARRLLTSGAVRIDGRRVDDISVSIDATHNGLVVQVGKKTQGSYRKLNISEKK